MEYRRYTSVWMVIVCVCTVGGLGVAAQTQLDDAWALKALAEQAVDLAREELLAKMYDTASTDVCGVVDQCEDPLPNAQTNEFFFANNVSFEADVVNFAGDAPVRDGGGRVTSPENLRTRICETSTLTSTVWESLIDEYGDSILWQFYGDQETGYMRTYPGTDDKRNCQSDFDPRLRAWYANAATGPRNVIFVVDKSGSMAQNNRWNIAKNAVRALIDTLTYVDYAAIVTFSDRSQTSASGKTMVEMTSGGKGALKTWIDSQGPNGGTNFEAGFERAFEVVDRSRRDGKISGCHQILIFLTDGEITSGANPSKLIKRANGEGTENDFRIFSYSIGANADHAIPKQLACENDGLWYAIRDGTDISSNVAQTYIYFAAKYASEGLYRWSEPYVDGLGLGVVRTVCLPIYDFLTELAGSLHGAVCSDIDEDMFQTLTDAGAVAAQMRRDSEQCAPLYYEFNELEDLRMRSGTETCGDKYNPDKGNGKGNGEGKGGNSKDVIIGVCVPLGICLLVIFIWRQRRQRNRMGKVQSMATPVDQRHPAPARASAPSYNPSAPPPAYY